jgi:hypothetical protein
MKPDDMNQFESILDIDIKTVILIYNAAYQLSLSFSLSNRIESNRIELIDSIITYQLHTHTHAL